MALAAGSHRLGPANARLSVHTKRGGAAAKAGHDLELHVTAWEGTVEVADDGAVTVALDADPTSLRVHKGEGGMQALGDDDKANIHQTIDDEVLERRDIRFRSTAVEADGAVLHVTGELTLGGKSRPESFDLTVGDDGALGGRAVIAQTAFGMKPYSALFGALKVLDEVEIVLDEHHPG